MKKQIIFPSLMAKSQQEFKEDENRLKGVVKELHLDIVDGKFAKNKTFQFPFRLSQNFCYNVHLMVMDVNYWINKLIKRRQVKTIFFHPEVVDDVNKAIKKIKQNHKKVGLALLPQTKVKEIKDYLNKVDFVLILTVKPGFYGSKFLSAPLKKINYVRKIKPSIKIFVDGGMNPETIKKAKSADFLVSGSYTTKADNPRERLNQLRKCI